MLIFSPGCCPCAAALEAKVTYVSKPKSCKETINAWQLMVSVWSTSSSKMCAQEHTVKVAEKLLKTMNEGKQPYQGKELLVLFGGVLKDEQVVVLACTRLIQRIAKSERSRNS